MKIGFSIVFWKAALAANSPLGGSRTVTSGRCLREQALSRSSLCLSCNVQDIRSPSRVQCSTTVSSGFLVKPSTRAFSPVSLLKAPTAIILRKDSNVDTIATCR